MTRASTDSKLEVAAELKMQRSHFRVALNVSPGKSTFFAEKSVERRLFVSQKRGEVILTSKFH